MLHISNSGAEIAHVWEEITVDAAKWSEVRSRMAAAFQATADDDDDDEWWQPSKDRVGVPASEAMSTDCSSGGSSDSGSSVDSTDALLLFCDCLSDSEEEELGVACGELPLGRPAVAGQLGQTMPSA